MTEPVIITLNRNWHVADIGSHFNRFGHLRVKRQHLHVTESSANRLVKWCGSHWTSCNYDGWWKCNVKANRYEAKAAQS